MTIKIGITGSRGYVGRELLKYPNTFPLVCDVRDSKDVEMAIKSEKPDLVVHLASVSDVDVCEDKDNTYSTYKTNVVGTIRVADACEKFGCGMMLMSSSQVFSGNWGNYREWNKPKPKNYYGLTKLVAESYLNIMGDRLKTVRTSYLFDLSRIEDKLDVLNGRVLTAVYPTFIKRSFMYLPHFCKSLYQYLVNFEKMPKILHISGTETVSWYDFMKSIAQASGMNDGRIIPRKFELDSETTPRPYNAGLNVGKSNRLHLPQFSYYDGIKEMLV